MKKGVKKVRKVYSTQDLLKNLEKSANNKSFDLKERLESLKAWRDISSRSKILVG